MTLLGHMRKRLKSFVEAEFMIHHWRDPVPMDETIHVFEMLARANLARATRSPEERRTQPRD
jgi:hypothetical protein